MIDDVAYRLALTQLPAYRQYYSADFSILDAYRMARMLLASEHEKLKKNQAASFFRDIETVALVKAHTALAHPISI